MAVTAGGDEALTALRHTLDAEIAGTPREAIMAANYAALRAGPIGKQPAYGMWGLFHVLQGGFKGTTLFAALVWAASPRERVASAMLVPIDSRAPMPVPIGSASFTPMKLDIFNVTGPVSKMGGR